MQPEATIIMLYADRPQFIKRALSSFRSQTYENKYLLIYDNGKESLSLDLQQREMLVRDQPRELSIGALRNAANFLAKSTILIHGDVDDWSHPNRIEEQVALLKASGKQAVGYRDMLFWRVTGFKQYETDVTHGGSFGGEPDTDRKCAPVYREEIGEAWLYSNADQRYCLGTSLCYWREAWERRPFPDLSRGEDKAWLREVDSLGVFSSIARDSHFSVRMHPTDEPRMIASVHAGNTSTPDPSTSSNFTRVPKWDSYCCERMVP